MDRSDGNWAGSSHSSLEDLLLGWGLLLLLGVSLLLSLLGMR